MAADNRRNFFLTIVYGLWGVITAALALPAAGYLLIPPKTRKGAAWVPVGELTELQPGTPSEMVFRRNRVDGWKVTSEKTSAWVVKTGDNQVIAFAPGCTHLGCAYHWDETGRYFLCPCHTSTFGLDGKVLSGPAPRPLDRFEARVQNGKVLIGPVQKGTNA